MTLAAGRLCHRVRIERYVLAVDSNGDVAQAPETGETSGSWQEVATVYAAIEPLSAREFIAAQSTQSQITARIVIRQRPGLNAAMRLVHMVNGARGPLYNIHGLLADPDSGLEYITMPVSAGLIEDEPDVPTTGQSWDGGATWDGGTLWS